MEASEIVPRPQAAGFWRRVGAFVLDTIFVGLFGLVLGFLLGDQLSLLGVWGRAVGFVIALGYFGLLNSTLTGGRTPGKRILGIKVVDAHGKPLSIARAAIRFVPVGLPWFLNNAPFPEQAMFSFWIYPLCVAIFGLGLSVIYLLIFNRPYRQSLDDLIVGSFVVKAEASGEIPPVPLPMQHRAACALVIVAAALVPAFTGRLARGETFAPIFAVYRAVSAEPWIAHVELSRGVSYRTGGPETHYLLIDVKLSDPVIADARRPARLAKLAVEADPTVRSLDVVQINLSYGFDIGIASSWRSQSYTLNGADLALID